MLSRYGRATRRKTESNCFRTRRLRAWQPGYNPRLKFPMEAFLIATGIFALLGIAILLGFEERLGF